jgi:hypothetical protein
MNAASGSIATTRLGCALGTQSFGFYPLRSTPCPIVGWQTNIPGLGPRLGRVRGAACPVPPAVCRARSAILFLPGGPANSPFPVRGYRIPIVVTAFALPKPGRVPVQEAAVPSLAPHAPVELQKGYWVQGSAQDRFWVPHGWEVVHQTGVVTRSPPARVARSALRVLRVELRSDLRAAAPSAAAAPPRAAGPSR